MMRCPLLPATLCLSLVLLQAHAARADGVLPAAATPVQREQAQSRFMRGKELMSKKRYEEALAEFRASRDIVASPNSRLELARCLVAMGNWIAAYAELGRTAIEAKELMSEDNRYRRAYDAAMAERAEVEPKLGFVSLTVQNPSEATRVLVGGEEIRRAAWGEPVPLQAGATDIVVETPGRQPVRRSVTLAAGEKTALAIDAQSGEPDAPPAPARPPEPPPAPRQPETWKRTGAYVAGGVGVLGLATFAVFGLMARSTYDDLNGACPAGACPPGKADEISAGKTQQTVANVGLAFGVAGAAVGATLLVLSLPRGDARAPGAALVVSPAYVGVRGSL